MTYHHFFHILLVTQTNHDLVWEEATQWHENQEWREDLWGSIWRLTATLYKSLTFWVLCDVLSFCSDFWKGHLCVFLPLTLSLLVNFASTSSVCMLLKGIHNRRCSWHYACTPWDTFLPLMMWDPLVLECFEHLLQVEINLRHNLCFQVLCRSGSCCPVRDCLRSHLSLAFFLFFSNFWAFQDFPWENILEETLA